MTTIVRYRKTIWCKNH